MKTSFSGVVMGFGLMTMLGAGCATPQTQTVNSYGTLPQDTTKSVADRSCDELLSLEQAVQLTGIQFTNRTVESHDDKARFYGTISCDYSALDSKKHLSMNVKYSTSKQPNGLFVAFRDDKAVTITGLG